MTRPLTSTSPPAAPEAEPAARGPVQAGAEAADEGSIGGIDFVLYCLFTASYFLHLGQRIPALGSLRIDMMLTLGTLVAIIVKRKPPDQRPPMELTTKLLLVLIVYIALTLPFVQWPGSVVDHGWEPFIKAAAFYMLTVQTVTSERRLAFYLFVFCSVQVFRVLEPLYLHITTGYWGSFTDLGNYEFMDRLSGSPHDIINPNGLAFVILVALSLLHHLLSGGKWKAKLIYLALLGPLIYAMMLTASRSGMLVLAVYGLMIVWNSKHRAIALVGVTIIVSVLFVNMDDQERQRYISIFDHSAKGGATSAGRVAGVWTDFQVGLERPIFGHGLGTSAEANYNATGEGLPSHTLPTEVLQELGFLGLGVFVAFMIVILRNCTRAVKVAFAQNADFMGRAAKSVRDFGVLLCIFSIASYGLSEYQWYFLAAMSVVLQRLVASNAVTPSTVPPPPPGPPRGNRRSNPGVKMRPNAMPIRG